MIQEICEHRVKSSHNCEPEYWCRCGKYNGGICMDRKNPGYVCGWYVDKSSMTGLKMSKFDKYTNVSSDTMELTK